MRQITWLGETEAAVDLKVWETYLRATNDSMVGAWDKAKAAYVMLRRMREAFGVPFILTGEAATQPEQHPGALTDMQQQQFVDVLGLVALLNTYMFDVFAGKRKVALIGGDLGIEKLSDDGVVIKTQQGRPVAINVVTGKPEQFSGAVGALIWVAALAAGVVAVVSQYYMVKVACETLKTMVESKTMQTGLEAVKAGKATPEQVSAIYNAAAGLEKAKAETEKAKAVGGPVSGIESVVKLGVIGLIVFGVILLAAQVIPAVTPARRALAA